MVFERETWGATGLPGVGGRLGCTSGDAPASDQARSCVYTVSLPGVPPPGPSGKPRRREMGQYAADSATGMILRARRSFCAAEASRHQSPRSARFRGGAIASSSPEWAVRSAASARAGDSARAKMNPK